jgi:HYR domain
MGALRRSLLAAVGGLLLVALFFASTARAEPPTLTLPSDITAEATGPGGAPVFYTATALDPEEGALTPSCTPESGATFSIGTTSVSCSVTDAELNTVTGSFNVTVHDTTAPAVTPPPDVIAEATGPGGAVVTFGSGTALDAVSGSLTAPCGPPSSDSTFGLGSTSVPCSATDGAGNTGTASFTVTVQDTTPPTLVGMPANITVSSATPTVVNYTNPTANDAVDPSPTVGCSPASGFTFPFGTTTVTCTATDASGNQATGSFTVTVQDPDAPVVTVPANMTLEANSAAGSVALFPDPASAIDNADGPLLADCVPSSGATFPIGVTTVTCSVTDSDGNTGTNSFTVTVQDTTPPTLVLPGNLILTSSTPVSRSSTAITSWLSFVSASDLVDPSVAITHNSPASFPVGVTTVTFTARDDFGNTVTRLRQVSVVANPIPGAISPNQPIPPSVRPDAPPGNVKEVTVKKGNRSIEVSWTPPADSDFSFVQIFRSPGVNGQEVSLVYKGSASSFKDKGLQHGQQYRYLIKAVDKGGNAAVGVAFVILAERNLLRSPANGARVTRPPLLTWAKDPKADYYNAQLHWQPAGSAAPRQEAVASAVTPRKVLSVWPKKNRLQLKKKWVYEGRRYTLRPGLYTWFVWPGFGKLSAADYGDLLGYSQFVVVKRPR